MKPTFPLSLSLLLLLLLLSLLLVRNAAAQVSVPRQNAAELRQAADSFLHAQTNELNGKVNILISAIDTRLNLPPCLTLEPFMPTGTRAWGKTTVGVRCLAPTPWTIYLQANVSLIADYLVAAMSLPQGQLITSNSLKKMTGDLSVLPASVVTDPSKALGRTLNTALPSGAPLRVDALRAQIAVQQGQAVRLVSVGPGFRISADARAMSNANEGQLVQVKTLAGQQISGIAKMGGQVEVNY